jgi:hypothetical protein
MLKVIAWYDNEYGYANRLVEETIMVGRRSAPPDAAQSDTSQQPASQPDTSQPS